MRRRSKRGNMIALIVAFCFIIIVILLFALGYVRLQGASSEQKTAIEAAALAAARDLSKIVLDTPEFGYIGISDSAPNGTATNAPDTFRTPVHSINTLLGTARLDYIIADALIASGFSAPELKELALTDLTAAKARSSQLVALLDGAIAPGGSASDKDGNSVTPYVSAEQAYTQNQIRMTGSSNYVAGSLQLQLGALEGGALTAIPIPKPIGTDPSLNNSNTMTSGTDTYYKSYINIPFDGQDFVFAGIGDSVRLVDPNLWRATLSGLPYYYRTIIRAEANQQVSEQGTQNNYTIKAAACAQPASVHDPLPAPGALQVSFPDGMPTGPEDINRFGDLYIYPAADNTSTCDYFKSNAGDYPVTPGSNINLDLAGWPVPSDSLKLASTSCKIALYDWLKRAGTKANVTSVIGMHNTPFDPQGADVPWGAPVVVGNIPRGICHIYRFDPDGVVSYESKDQKPQPYYVVSDNQTYIESYEVLQNGIPAGPLFFPIDMSGTNLATANGVIEFGQEFDMYVRIYSRRPGTTNGGLHAGEPMDNTFVASKPPQIHLASNMSSGTASVENMVVSGKGAGGLMKGWYKMGKKGKTKGGNNVPPSNIWNGTVGIPPSIIGRVDFMQTAPTVIETNPSYYEKYDATGGGIRWTYQTNGTVSDIRFRRVIWLADGVELDPADPDLQPGEIEETGYVGLKN